MAISSTAGAEIDNESSFSVRFAETRRMPFEQRLVV